MKKLILASIVLAIVAVPAMANPSVIMNTTSGGVPYIATVGLHGPVGIYTAGQTFDTFCLEKSEYFVPGEEYGVILNDTAVFGGDAAHGGPLDPLDFRTAYLYTQYMNGNASFQNPVMMQDAIWYIEQEISTSNAYVTLATNAGWTDIGNVRVMNLWDDYDDGLGSSYGKQRQDMLVMVPAPGALMLGSLGVSFVGWLRRRRSL